SFPSFSVQGPPSFTVQPLTLSARTRSTQHRCDSVQEGHVARFLFGIMLIHARVKLQIRSDTFSLSRENIRASSCCPPQVDEVRDEVRDEV
ncbi:MAG TPA: hypothetical protein PLN33_20660, partial [Hyphomonadaceae bacterium]|nr:hypothetical protein [Hyphomonadaceae bacterium]